MGSRHLAAVGLCAVIVSGAGCGAASSEKNREESAAGRPVSFRQLASGSRSGIVVPQELVVRSAEEWQRLWLAHEAGASPARPLPGVDFSDSVCIAIFAGERPTGGYAVKVERVVEAGGGLEVVYRVTGPAPGDIVSQALTSPFQVISVASRQAPVRFRRLPEG